LTELVIRPDFGNVGRPIRLRTNFFQIKNLPGTDIYHYDVTIIPLGRVNRQLNPILPKKLNRQVFRQFEKENRSGPLGGGYPVYDGRKNMFSHMSLPLTDDDTFTVGFVLLFWGSF